MESETFSTLANAPCLVIFRKHGDSPSGYSTFHTVNNLIPYNYLCMITSLKEQRGMKLVQPSMVEIASDWLTNCVWLIWWLLLLFLHTRYSEQSIRQSAFIAWHNYGLKERARCWMDVLVIALYLCPFLLWGISTLRNYYGVALILVI